MSEKPAHLAPRYAAQFADRAVVAAYRARPPYPQEVFDRLESLLPARNARVLELGCGSGDLTLGLAPRVGELDAVDVSAPMLEAARARAGARHPNVRFVHSSAEAFEPRAKYALAVAAESLHWMDWDLVLPCVASWLEPGGVLAIVDGRILEPPPWQAELARLVATHSTNRDFKPVDLVAELEQRGLFRELGRCRTQSIALEQNVDDYVESFHSRNGFSRERMSAASAAAFDAGVRAAVAPHAVAGHIRARYSALVVWGAPSGVVQGR
ncbi:MAG TPA: class I SAM-dependent methyltransferase [Myxococcota bacterium]|nr:class I SAM-dependent methyltransferase [Myxococcota bacterium]